MEGVRELGEGESSGGLAGASLFSLTTFVLIDGRRKKKEKVDVFPMTSSGQVVLRCSLAVSLTLHLSSRATDLPLRRSKVRLISIEKV